MEIRQLGFNLKLLGTYSWMHPRVEGSEPCMLSLNGSYAPVGNTETKSTGVHAFMPK